MNKQVPTVQESAAQLREQMKQERNPRLKQRLQALYLLASGQASSRHQVAELLGVHRNTIGTWLVCYERHGLQALLTLRRSPGAPASLDRVQTAQLQTALAEASGFSSYKAVQQWIAQHLGVEMAYPALHKLVRYRLGATLKVARPSHLKKTLPP